MNIWTYSICSTENRRVVELTRTLIDAGFQLSNYSQGDSKGLGILFIDTETHETHQMIARISLDKQINAIVVSCAERALSDEFLWRAMQPGIHDVVPHSTDEEVANSIISRIRRLAKIEELASGVYIKSRLVGESTVWKSILREVIELACFSDTTALILGESGTGKEEIARLIHHLDPRRSNQPFVVLDCSTLTTELAGSEFFGHEKGAYTGASIHRSGAFEEAHKGTLFLDEIGELPQILQMKLLRVLQNKVFKRLGSNRWHNTDFRLICATNKDLAAETDSGAFRLDLYYRIASWVLQLPRLVDRQDDIVLLANHFLNHEQNSGKKLCFDKAVIRYLRKRKYPGNVRDLYQLINRIKVRYSGYGPVTIGHIPDRDRPPKVSYTSTWNDQALRRVIGRALMEGEVLKDIGRTAENVAIRLALEQEGGKVKRAAKRLGVTDRAIQLRLAAMNTSD